MAKRHRPTRSARNQAKWDTHRALQGTSLESRQAPMAPTPGSSVTTSRVMNSGSIQGGPRKVQVGGGNKSQGIESPDPSSRRGIKLQPFTDMIPSVPSDYATLKSDHLRQRQIWTEPNKKTGERKRIWEVFPHDRERLDSEKADVREHHEAARIAVDRPSGAAEAATYNERHEDDKTAGLFRDNLGRIMRTVDMEEFGDKVVDLSRDDSSGWDDCSLTCEIDEVTSRVRLIEVNSRTGERRLRGHRAIHAVDSTMTTTDYARMHDVPIQRNQTQRADAKLKQNALKAEVREAKRARRQQEQADRIQRRLDRVTNRPSRAEADAMARAHLAKLGVPESGMNRALIKAAREVLEHQGQIKAYIDGNKAGV